MRGWLGAFRVIPQPSLAEQGGAGSAPGPGIRPRVLTGRRKGLDLGRGPHPQRALGHWPLSWGRNKRPRVPPQKPASAPSPWLPAPQPSLLSPWDVDGARGCTLMGFTGIWEEVGGEVCGAAQEEKPHWLRGSWSSSRKDSQFATPGDFPGSWGDSRKWESREARSLRCWRPPRHCLPGKPERLPVESRPHSDVPVRPLQSLRPVDPLHGQGLGGEKRRALPPRVLRALASTGSQLQWS